MLNVLFSLKRDLPCSLHRSNNVIHIFYVLCASIGSSITKSTTTYLSLSTCVFLSTCLPEKGLLQKQKELETSGRLLPSVTSQRSWCSSPGGSELFQSLNGRSNACWPWLPGLPVIITWYYDLWMYNKSICIIKAFFKLNKCTLQWDRITETL